MRKKTRCLLLAMVLVLSSVLMTGCGSEKAGENGELNVYFWTEYFPEELITKFQDETGIKVNFSTYSSNEDMLNKIKSEEEGAYDICVPTDYMVDMMKNQELLEVINTENIPNLSNVDSAYLGQYYDLENEYSIPYMGGCATLCVNTDKITEEITSWSQIFDSEKYSNSLCVLDDTRAVVGLAAKSLGYTMSETDPAILEEIQARLLELKPIIKAFDSDNPKSLLIGGEVDMAYCWNAEIALAISENPAMEIVFPEEGTYLFLDNLCIPKGAKNKENAEKFINFILDPENSKVISEEFPYLNPNKAALELLGEEYINNPASNVPSDVIANGEYVMDVGDSLEIYDKMWTELTK